MFSVSDTFSLTASDSDVFPIGIDFGNVGEKGTQTSFISIIFVYLYKLGMDLLHFPRLCLNLNLSNPGKSWSVSVFISLGELLKLACLLVLN